MFALRATTHFVHLQAVKSLRCQLLHHFKRQLLGIVTHCGFHTLPSRFVGEKSVGKFLPLVPCANAENAHR
jgi:hypothetical protein